MIERRALITGLAALVAAPAIVKASSLMKVAPTEKLSRYWEYNPLLDKWTQYSRLASLTLQDYNERVVQPSLQAFAEQHRLDHAFYDGEQWEAAQVGDVVRIRLPNDYVADAVSHSADAFAYGMIEHHGLQYNKVRRSIDRVPQIPTALGVAALAVAAAPVVEQALQKPVTRRFWSK
jgi:hypothetical protein